MNFEDLELKEKSVWQNVDETEHKTIFEYNEGYKIFLNEGKTEREVVSYIEKVAKEKGFVDLEEKKETGIKKGDKIYVNQKGKAMILFVMGEDIKDGMNIVGSHIDSPRLDLKQRPLYEDSNLALFKTHYYGGIKKYQWPTLPLALHGFVINKDGEKFDIKIGENEDDPVFYITDLLAHLSKDQTKKALGEGIPGETLNIVVGHSTYGIDTEKEKDNPIKKLILKHLNDEYGMVEEDFIVSEIEAVPLFNSRDVGFDRAMIAAHGHDDRVCSYANLKAILETENPERTAVGIFYDKEEIGSVGNTSATGPFLQLAVAELIEASGDYSDLYLRRAFANSKLLSADVIVGEDPDYKEVTEERNTAKIGCGVSMAKYTGAAGKSGTNDANAEFVNEIRNLFNKNDVIWQTGELGKVDQGGGGTIAGFLASTGAEVLDVGTPMLSMHAPIELVSKADSYMTYKAYKVFLNE